MWRVLGKEKKEDETGNFAHTTLFLFVFLYYYNLFVCYLVKLNLLIPHLLLFLS